MSRTLSWLALALVLVGCHAKQEAPQAQQAEDQQAKALLQGVWINVDDEEVAFRAQGDTIYFPDSTSMPAYFQVVADSLYLGPVIYKIERQTEHLFWFRNPNGDVVKLQKSNTPEEHEEEFSHDQPTILTVTEVVKTDSVVFMGGERYHWYIAVNPTKYRVTKTIYNDDGVGVENVYYDNIIHLSVFQGKTQLFSSDFRKPMFEGKVPTAFLQQAIMANMSYRTTDHEGLHFDLAICIPDGASCYLFDVVVDAKGKLTMRLTES